MYRILVCVKAVPNTTDVSFDADGRLHRSNTTLQWNVADLAALESALSIKTQESTVTVLSMGPQKLETPLKELLARGADNAVLISDTNLAGSDTYATARVLAQAVEKLGGFDLILCGKQSIDGDTGQVPGMLAAALNQPCLTNTENLTFNGRQLTADRVLENGVQKLSVTLPCVVSVQPYAYNLRLPGILAMRKAQQKMVQLFDLKSLELSPSECGQAGSLTKVIKIHPLLHSRRKGVKEHNLRDGTKRLLDLIREVK